MPASPTYCHRIPAAVASLRQSDGDWVDRRQLEELLGISKTVAWRLLRHCGAEPGPGNTLICRRLTLIASLERLQAEGAPWNARSAATNAWPRFSKDPP